jgi:hypothetical protein
MTIMETVIVQINNRKVYWLLENLEDLQIIKILKKNISSDISGEGNIERRRRKNEAVERNTIHHKRHSY